MHNKYYDVSHEDYVIWGTTGKKSPVWDYGVTKVIPFCIKLKGMWCLRGKCLATLWQGGKKSIKKYDVQLNYTAGTRPYAM